MSRRGRIALLAAAIALLAVPSSALSDPPRGSNTTARGQSPGLADHCQVALQQALKSCSRDYPRGTRALSSCVSRAEQVATTCESIHNLK